MANVCAYRIITVHMRPILEYSNVMDIKCITALQWPACMHALKVSYSSLPY